MLGYPAKSHENDVARTAGLRQPLMDLKDRRIGGFVARPAWQADPMSEGEGSPHYVQL